MSVLCDSYTWIKAPEAFGWPRGPPFPVQPLPKAPPSLQQETPVPAGPYKSTNTQYHSDTQSQHVQMSCSCCLASANGVGYHGAATVTDLAGHKYPQTMMNGLGNVSGTVDWPMNPTNSRVAVDQVGLPSIDPSLSRNTTPWLEDMRAEERPAKYNNTRLGVPYTRRTRSGRRAPVGGPPQRFESIPDVLLARLDAEGADPDAIDLLRHVIFVGQVTEEALTAPIKSSELSLKYGGVKTMWQLLFQVTKMAPGSNSFCCRLCPQERRPEYKNAIDGLRHLKRDHFGISVACQYW